MASMTMRHAGSLPWMDVELGKDAEADAQALAELQAHFGLHPVVVKELMSPSPRARAEDFGEYLFLAYQFPVYDEKNFVSRRAEVDFIVTRDAVVTVHYEKLHALDFAIGQRDPHHGTRTDSAGFEILYHIVSNLLSFNQRQLRHIDDKVEAVAASLFTQHNRELLERISYLKRDVSEYRIIFDPIGQLLDSLVHAGERFFGQPAVPYLLDLHADYLRTFQLLEDYRAAILDYEATNSQLMNARNGDVIRVLTMVSLITYPLTLLGTMFAIRLDGIPFMGHAYGFWVLSGLMLCCIVGALVYFRHKRWI